MLLFFPILKFLKRNALFFVILLSMILFVCLGNPGLKYARTRHNAGFIIGQAFVDAQHLSLKGEKFKALLYEGFIEGEKVLVAFPQTYMNLSGQAVVQLKQFFQIDMEKILIIYDDFELPFGALRLRKKGGPGTHNGMKSIVGLLGSKDFPRLRVGVGPKPEFMNTSDFVLSNFSQDEERELATQLPAFVDAMTDFWKKGIDLAMNFHNPAKKP
ncbi:MAG: PTH1 family peptidyl-tRNA hydrolase, partial [Candidatus Marinamargulisbacteria bacterium]